MPPPKIQLIGIDGNPILANTTPDVGQNDASESLPVVLARGVRPSQVFIPIPKYSSTDSSTVVKIVNDNPNRRYLKVINNGLGTIELWTGAAPTPTQVGQINGSGGILQGEICAPKGGFVEVGERISSIYATAYDQSSGLLVIEG